MKAIFGQMNTFNDLYTNLDKLQLENATIRYMILNKRKFEDIKDQIHNDLYERLVNRKKRVEEEDKQIRENMIGKLCVVESEEHMKSLLQSLESFLRNKARAIVIMGGNYEEVK